MSGVGFLYSGTSVGELDLFHNFGKDSHICVVQERWSKSPLSPSMEFASEKETLPNAFVNQIICKQKCL